MKNDELVVLKKPKKEKKKPSRLNSENFYLNFKKKQGTTHRNYSPQKLVIDMNNTGHSGEEQITPIPNINT